MSEILFPGDPADLVLSPGDRFEIREARPGFVRTIKRQDFVDADSLVFDPGEATTLEFVLGGRNRPIHSPFVERHIAGVVASTRALGRER